MGLQAAATRIAGRHLAGVRGAFERDPGHFGAELAHVPRPRTAPLREFLSERSWRAVLTILARLERRAAA